MPEIDAAIDVKAGRFLAGDRGVRVAASKFVRGVTLSAWYSATGTGMFTDPFNRGYHDKGISVEIPIRLFTGRDSKTAYRYSLSPWTRDVAQDIDRYLPLFDRIGRNAGVLLDRDQESTYRGAEMKRRFNEGDYMRGTRLRSTVKSVVAILCAACFLAVSLGSVSRAVAADAFETWPKKTTEPGVEPQPATEADGAAKAGDAAGKKTATGLSSGTIGWIALGTAVVIGIAVAAGGGGGSSSSPVCNQ